MLMVQRGGCHKSVRKWRNLGKITYLSIAQLGRGFAGEVTALLAYLRNITPVEEHPDKSGRWAAASVPAGSRAAGMRDGCGKKKVLFSGKVLFYCGRGRCVTITWASGHLCQPGASAGFGAGPGQWSGVGHVALARGLQADFPEAPGTLPAESAGRRISLRGLNQPSVK